MVPVYDNTREVTLIPRRYRTATIWSSVRGHFLRGRGVGIVRAMRSH